MALKGGIQAGLSHILTPVKHSNPNSKNNSPIKHETETDSVTASPVHNGVHRKGSFVDNSRNALETFLTGDLSQLEVLYPAYGKKPQQEGEKNHGFDVLYHNMKHGQISVKYLQDFIRESAVSEDLHAKHLMKLAKQAANSSTLGSFAPMFEVFRTMAEKLSSCHNDVVHKLQEIIKDLSKYLEDQKGKHKQVKDGLSGTADALHQIQTTTAAVHKSKEKYHQLCMETERLKRSGVLQKDVEKSESKMKKAIDEYKGLVAKHATVRNNFENKMTESAKRFQEIEVAHLKHMKSFLDSYILSFENANILVGQVHQEFRRQVDENTIDSLIKKYCDNKGTGTEKPSPVEFELCDVDSMLASVEPAINGGSPDEGITPPPVTKGSRRLPFLRRRKVPKESAGSIKDADKDAESIESPDKESQKIDEEGYTIRPETPKGSKNSFGFDSSDDSDSDDDYMTRKIRVKINPKTEQATVPSGNIDALNQITRNLTLNSPTARVGKGVVTNSGATKKPKDFTAAEKTEKTCSDELLDLFGNNSTAAPRSISLTDASRNNNNVDLSIIFGSSSSLPPKKEKLVLKSSISESSSDKPPNNIFMMQPEKERNRLNPTLSNNENHIITGTSSELSTARPNNLSLLNMRPDTLKVGSTISAPLTSSESWSSLSSFGGTPMDSFASSRGPSPLTLMQGDPIPIAAAFTETVHAYFKGSTTDRCMVKITGEVQISFPAGIIRAFTSNPNPSVLSFKVKGTANIQDFAPNPNLLFADLSHSDVTERLFWFNMTSLISYIKKMTENNPNAPYYNVQVLTYQMTSSSGYDIAPLHISAHWNCDVTTTDITIDYKYNSQSTSTPLKNLQILVPVNGGVVSADSVPQANWIPSQNRVSWKLPSAISNSSPSGSLKSKLSLSSGPSTSSTLAVQFISEGSTLTGADFELTGSGYRLSLVKKRFVSGKYLSDGS